MTKLNLTETALLEASGELNPAARERLQAYFRAHPAAQAQFDRVKGELDLLRSAPLPTLTAAQKLQYAGNIKGGIHKKLRQIDREEKAANRRRFIHGALAGISSAAAAIIVAATVWTYSHPAAQTTHPIATSDSTANKLADNIDIIQDSSNSSNSNDEALNNIQASIHKLESESPTLLGVHDADMSNLLDALATVPGRSEDAPDPQLDLN